MRYVLGLFIIFSAVHLFAYSGAECRLVRVIDGDTIVCDFSGWPDIIGSNISVRLRGCDAPEIRTLDTAEKALGLQAKSGLESALAKTQTITVRNISRGKYFRIIGDVYSDGLAIGCGGEKVRPLALSD